MNSPERLGASIVLLASVMLLRQADRKLEGFVLLLLAPAFFYVTFQNFGNDPKWTWFLGLVLLRLRPAHEVRGEFGYDTRQPIFIAAVLSSPLPHPRSPTWRSRRCATWASTPPATCRCCRAPARIPTCRCRAAG
ncbi:MAG: hypothetical protein R3D59_13205 [Paracoccaceae bacterium]